MKKFMIGVIVLIITITTTTVYAYSEGLVKTNNKEVFNINFQNVNEIYGKGNVLLENNTNLTFDCDLDVPGDYYEFTVDMVNNSNKDAKIESTYITELTKEQQRYLTYTVTYEDGQEIKTNDILRANDNVTLKVRVEFKFDITEEDLPKEEQNIGLDFNVTMIEK